MCSSSASLKRLSGLPGLATSKSVAEALARLPQAEREKIVSSLRPQEAEALLFDWQFWARAEQLPPEGRWTIWLVMAGRGFGKTRTGAEWVRARVKAGARRIALVGDTAADVRDVMVLGESGVCSIGPPNERPEYRPSYRSVVWPNGATATLYSADDPDQLRGPQHDTAWVDELAKWRRAQAAWDNLLFGLRSGDDPRVVVTTTPRPTPIIKSLLADPTCVVTSGSTYDNLANLPPRFIERVIRRYEGTRLGRQELYAEVLTDVQGALWRRDTLDRFRVWESPGCTRVVVAVDPAAGYDPEQGHAETGIVVVGLGRDGHGYVLDDRSCYGHPTDWGQATVTAYREAKADRVIAEANQGGEMVAHVLWSVDPYLPVTLVHASRGKATRAEPVAALFERGLIHLVGSFPELEDQLCTWVPGEGPSPDRLDALVWAVTALFFSPGEEEDVVVYDEPVMISPV